MTKATWRGKGLLTSTSAFIINRNQDRNSNKAGPKKHEMMQSSWTSATYWLAARTLLRLASHKNPDYQTWCFKKTQNLKCLTCQMRTRGRYYKERLLAQRSRESISLFLYFSKRKRLLLLLHSLLSNLQLNFSPFFFLCSLPISGSVAQCLVLQLTLFNACLEKVLP